MDPLDCSDFNDLRCESEWPGSAAKASALLSNVSVYLKEHGVEFHVGRLGVGPAGDTTSKHGAAGDETQSCTLPTSESLLESANAKKDDVMSNKEQSNSVDDNLQEPESEGATQFSSTSENVAASDEVRTHMLQGPEPVLESTNAENTSGSEVQRKEEQPDSKSVDLHESDSEEEYKPSDEEQSGTIVTPESVLESVSSENRSVSEDVGLHGPGRNSNGESSSWLKKIARVVTFSRSNPSTENKPDSTSEIVSENAITEEQTGVIHKPEAVLGSVTAKNGAAVSNREQAENDKENSGDAESDEPAGEPQAPESVANDDVQTGTVRTPEPAMNDDVQTGTFRTPELELKSTTAKISDTESKEGQSSSNGADLHDPDNVEENCGTTVGDEEQIGVLPTPKPATTKNNEAMSSEEKSDSGDSELK